jgi:hypothetical protein
VTTCWTTKTGLSLETWCSIVVVILVRSLSLGVTVLLMRVIIRLRRVLSVALRVVVLSRLLVCVRRRLVIVLTGCEGGAAVHFSVAVTGCEIMLGNSRNHGRVARNGVEL